MALQALRGTSDVLPEAITRWSAVEHTARRVSRCYGYQELRTPLIEDATLFLRSVGETTDIVQKEMFRFEDRGGHEIVLRPEGTASVVRAYLEGHLHKTEGFSKLFYLGPMFRAERPQAGRFRQFHQFGVEAIGSASPWVDAEVVTLCVEILRACGLADLTVLLSSMGCRADQARSAEQLRERLRPSLQELCKDCQGRFDKNVFRVLDCKNPACHALAWKTSGSPRPTGSHGIRGSGGHEEVGRGSPFVLCADCQAHFEQVRQALGAAGVGFDDTAVFARGLDYYTRTVFEVRAQGLGAQDAVAAGGRYDQLVEELGGPSMGAVGFAAGIERLLRAQEHGRAPSDEQRSRRGVYLAIAQPALAGEGFRLVQQLRSHGVCALMDYDHKSLKAQLREADKARCQFVAILGEAEVKQRAITLKDLEQSSQETVPLEAFAQTVAQRAKTAAAACHA
ncbi:MAG: histidine--tRNA ligase [Candidatus Omnitrophica bacterium]|nr:histidine--tRNA ligase [Candidatus Omnitrophota bacterium]